MGRPWLAAALVAGSVAAAGGAPALSAEPAGARAAPVAAAGAGGASPPAQGVVASGPFDGEIAAAKAAMMAKPEVALDHARRAAVLAGREDRPEAQVSALTAAWLQGEALKRIQKPEQALEILDGAAATSGRLAPNSKLNGDILKARGHALRALGRVQPALADYQNAFEIFRRANEPRSQALTLQAIASVYQQARDDAQALRYYAQSDEIYSADQQMSLASHNNRGMVLRDRGQLAQAHAEFAKALQIADDLGSANLQAQIYPNLVSIELMAGRLSTARAIVQRGLALTEHDAETSGERPFLLGAAAEVAWKAGQAAEAGRLFDQTFAGVDLTQTAMEFRDYHEAAAQVYERLGDRNKALAHLKAFKRLDDMSRSLAASASAALVAARFDFANQDLRIARLKEGQLERDVKLARSQARLHTVIVSFLGAAGVAVFLATLTGFLYMRRSRNRIRAARDQLALANVSLEKALAAKTEFLATTSHEIRTPLNGILGMTQVVLADPDVRGKLRDRVNLVQTAGEAMKLLVDDLLDVAKTESGALNLVHEPFPLDHVMAQTRDFWAGKAQSKGLHLRVEAQVPPRAVGDQDRIRQVLFNLVSNAIKFTDQGGVDVHASHADGVLTVKVSDTGVGVGPEDHERIFEPFTQVEGGKSRRFAGTGLGLSICRNIVAAMGGSISLESRLGEGAAFTVSLPLAAAEATAAAAPSHQGGTVVLVVDPNPLNRGIMKAALAPRFDRVTCTGDLREALTELKARRVDAVLADVAALGGAEGAPPDGLARLLAACDGAHLCVVCGADDAEELGAVTLGTGANRAGARIFPRPIKVVAVAEHLQAVLDAARPASALAA